MEKKADSKAKGTELFFMLCGGANTKNTATSLDAGTKVDMPQSTRAGQ